MHRNPSDCPAKLLLSAKIVHHLLKALPGDQSFTHNRIEHDQHQVLLSGLYCRNAGCRLAIDCVKTPALL